jgi:hypothetical protein
LGSHRALISIPIIHIKQQVDLREFDMAPSNPETVNKWAGRIVPTFLAGTVAYATYVFVAQLCGESEFGEEQSHEAF